MIMGDTNSPDIEQIDGFVYLDCFYTNTDCLTNKIDELKEKIVENSPQMASIVETAIQSNPLSERYCPDEILLIPGYQMFRQDNENDIKGGILIYIRDDILVSENKILNNLSADLKESRWLELEVSGNKMILGTIYIKGHSGAFNNKLVNQVIHKASLLYEKVLICGDLNYPGINWKTFEVDSGPFSSPAQFLHCINDNYLQQHVTKITRVRGKHKPSLIDLIITENSQTLFGDVIHDCPIAKSDHYVLKWKYLVGVGETIATENKELPKKLNVNKGNYKELNDLLTDVNWEQEFKDKSIEECVDIFHTISKSHIEKCVPLKRTSKRKDKPPWMDKAARKQIKSKTCAWNRYLQSKTYQKYLDYVKCRNKTTKSLKKAKKEFERKLAADCKKNPKSFYRYANFKSKAHKKIIRLKNKNGFIAMSDAENANILNNFFSSVFTREDDSPELILNSSSKLLWGEEPNDPFEFNGKVIDDSIGDITVDQDTVKTYLMDIDPNKSNTQECIHPRILKECAEGFSLPVTLIYQMSLQHGTVPPQWKKGIVTPIHKNGSRHMAQNYRPITMTSMLCRILEKIIKKTVVAHLDHHEYLSNCQHGFRQQRSCLSNLIMNLEEITSMIDNMHSVDQIYLDFQKAFDKVPHQRLIFKLEKAGISGKVLNWIESFLSHRQQCVKINGSYSNWTDVKSGVPQGSVLGPILFILFINDLPDSIDTCSCSIFADDTKLNGRVDSDEDANSIQCDINNLHDWCNKWKLVFNSDKCHVMHFGSKNRKNYYHINGRLISPVMQEKDLGVIISADLKAENNVVYSVNKANRILGMIKRTFSYLNHEMLAQLFKVFVRPHLEFAQQAWSPYLRKDIDLLEGVQRRGTKLLKVIEDLPYAERLKELNMYSIEERLRRGDMILMYRIMTQDIGISRDELFKPVKSSITRGHHMKIHSGKPCNLDLRQKFFTERVIEPWNSLPAHIVNSKSVNEFKNEYDKWRGLVQ